MPAKYMHRLLILIIVLGLLGQQANAFTLLLDYTHDTATDNFFGQRATAKAALDAAAADISAAITSSLSAIDGTGNPNVDSITGTSGAATATADWDIDYTNPSTGGAVSLVTPVVPANTVTIFVGMSELAGSALGVGGPSGVGVGFSFSGSGIDLTNAVNNMQTASNTYMGRGSGPTIGTVTGNLGGNPYSLVYGAAIGSLSLDIDTNNDLATDSLAVMDAFWHYDHTTAVAALKNDLYSVALHEMLHALGMGTADSWDSLVSGTNWLGVNAIALDPGLGINLIDGDGSHIRSAFMSTSIYDASAQEAVMDPTLTVGTRKRLTQMDLAMMRDIGWLTVPEPGRALLCLTGTVFILLRRRRKTV